MIIKRKPRNSPKTVAYIDSQNLNLSTQKMGWKIDWRKFRQYLKTKYNVSIAYTFIGYMSENEQLYEYMNELGYTVVLKPTLVLDKENSSNNPNNKDKATVKGNVDVELTLYAVKDINNYDRAIIISGDGDFYSLIEFINSKGKLYKIITPNWQYSSLLKVFDSKIEKLDNLRGQLSYRDRKRTKSS